MKKLINEQFKRMQLLAGLITESQLEEVDSSLLGGIAKNLYLYLSKMKPNNPVDVNGAPLKNVKGDIITASPKVRMTYQNPELGKKGQAKELEKIAQGGDNTSNAEVHISYMANIIFVGRFNKKEEAEAALKYILDKYPNQLNGLNGEPKVDSNKFTAEWAKDYAPRYSFDLKLKDDKEIAKGQSANPSSAKSPTPTAESINIKQSVNEGMPVGKSKLAQELAQKLNIYIGKIQNPQLQNKAMVHASKIIELIDKDSEMGESIEQSVNEALRKYRRNKT